METTNKNEKSSIYQEKQFLLTMPMPSDFYVTNRQDIGTAETINGRDISRSTAEARQVFHSQLHPVSKYRFLKVYNKFAWCLFTSEKSFNLLIFRIVPNGNTPIFVPYDDQFKLINPREKDKTTHTSTRRRKAISASDHTVKSQSLNQMKSVQIYVNSEDLTLSQTEMSMCQISKSKTLPKYIVGQAQNCHCVQQYTDYCDAEEVQVQLCFDGEYKSDVTLVEAEVVLANSPRIHESTHVKPKIKSPNRLGKQHSSTSNPRTRKVFRKVCGHNRQPKRNKHRRMRKEDGGTINSTNRYPQATKTAKHKEKTAQETNSGSGVLAFSRKSSAFNVLKDYSPKRSDHVLHRSPNRRSVPTALQVPAGVQSKRSTFLGITHRDSPRVDVGGEQHLTDSYRAASRRLCSDGSFVNTLEYVTVARLPFVATEITKLLHASDYSKIVQQLASVPKDIQSDSLIPLLFILGVAYFKLAKYKDAQENFKQCEAVAKRVNRDGDVMLCNAYLGDMEYATQKYVEAANYYKTAIRHYTNGCVAVMFKLTPPTISAIHAKLASSYRNARMMVQAIHHYKKAVEVAQIDRDRLSAHTSLGNLYQSIGDNSNALAEYKQSIELANKLSDRVSLGWAHGNIGNAYLGLNRKDEAVHHLQKSLDLAVEYEQTPQAIGRTYNNLGTAYQSMNDLDKAEEYYDLALSQAVYGNDIAGQARVYGNIGNVHMLRKNYERAIPHYSEVLRLSSDPATISTARHNRGCAYYEWATSLMEKSQKTGQAKYTFHGSECDVDVCLSKIPNKVLDLYRKGCEDLREVVKYHEDQLRHIKGSPSGLTLSVSLFESNSRTFHRLQDCLVNLHRYEEALVVAEQSRARTLGELLLKRKEKQLTKQLSSPLCFDQMLNIVDTLKWPLVYFSYTGARIICWIFSVHSVSGKRMVDTFELPLADDQFDGKAFDYHLRYSLTEKLVERSFEMYQSIEYNSESSAEVQDLFTLVGKPMVTILQKQENTFTCTLQVTTVSDSYTSLLPLTCLHDHQTESFLGDHYFFNIAPSLLSFGLLNEFRSTCVGVQEEECLVVGDPSIPPFYLNGELWHLGRLPYAKREAKWVAHALKATPMLGDRASKGALLIRLMNAKVVHIATHGSASSGFLAFAAFGVSVQSGTDKYVEGSNVLLYPQDVEKLHISPALVVLSSCDSGRGTVKADGIQGMARAFILAGAQSVLTTLWKVPDESASVFMQFFYQYLMDGLKSSLALHKAILSVRCFAKYSQYIHWSGYQLTGRDTQLSFEYTSSSTTLEPQLGCSSIFPRLAVIKALEEALLIDPSLPTDVQILRGPPGVEPSEVAIDFIYSFHKQFSAGVFWINCQSPEIIQFGIESIEKVCGYEILNLAVSETQQALFIFDHMSDLPGLESLLRVLKNRHVHIIVISKEYKSIDKLTREVDRKLLRGCSTHKIEPLTRIHSTQRLVHKLMNNVYFAPTTADQQLFEELAEFTTGSPPIIAVTSQILLDRYRENHSEAARQVHEILSLKSKQDKTHPSHYYPVRPLSENVLDKITTVSELSENHRDVWETDSVYDSWDSITSLIHRCDLTKFEMFLLNCLSVFGCNPLPLSLVTEMSHIIAMTGEQVHLTRSLYQTLAMFKFVKPYPTPVVSYSCAIELVYVPQCIAECVWNNLKKVDKVAVLNVIYYYAVSLLNQRGSYTSHVPLYMLCSLFSEVFGQNYTLIGKEPYKDMCTVLYNLLL